MYSQAIKYLRVNILKITMRVMSKKLDISHPHLNNIEKGHCEMSMQLLDKINRTFKTDIALLHCALFNQEIPETLRTEIMKWLNVKLKS
jgi:DNA-binding XRE family transcriptional regulator